MSRAAGGPLAGVRVTDFFWLIAGPATSRVLADFGADVIKVESQSRVDQIREAGVWPPQPTAVSVNATFNDCNTNKRSVTLNLNDPRGIDLAKELVRRSDVVTNNFTGSRMDRWGLGYEDLRRVRPDIIMLTMPVMGTTGPRAHFGANGLGVLAASGLARTLGFPGRPPVGMGPLYSDFVIPYFGVSAIMAALHHRERTGEGQFIDLAQVQAAASLLGPGILEYAANGHVPPPPGNRSRDDAPHGAYRCAGEDRWCAVAVRGNDDWRRLCAAIDRPDLAADGRFAAAAGRMHHQDEIDEALEAWTRGQDAWQVMHRLQAAGIAAGVVEDLEDIVTRDPQLMAMHFQELTDAGGETRYLTHAQPGRIDGETPALGRPPLIGEHNEEVFKGLLGLDDERYTELLVDRVIY
jgi:benzylsuccinate CoA-transferase BbsF subunit